MSFERYHFLARDLVRVVADSLRSNLGGSRRLNSLIGGQHIRNLPDFWTVDKLSDEYLLRLKPEMREDHGQDSFLFFSHGALIAIWMKSMHDDASIQDLPRHLENHRSELQHRFVQALREHGVESWRGGGQVEPKFVGDNIDFCSVL